MEYFSKPFHINILKNHILKDPIIDWFNIQDYINHKYIKDPISHYKKFIIKESSDYKKKIIKKIKDSSKLINIPENPDINQTIQMLKEGSPLITSGKLILENMIVHCDIIIRKDYFNQIFPRIKNVPLDLLCNHDKEYILINISYSSIHFKMDLKESINDGILPYKKCCLYAFQLAISNIIKYKPTCLILGKEYYYKKTLLTKKEFISHVIIDDKIKTKYQQSRDWINNLQKNYLLMDIDPKPTHKELYPNMNYKESQWENEKYQLANKIKEITLVWSISYEERCSFLEKNITCWDDPKLLTHLKESKKKDIQERMIHMNQQNDILIYPRKNISNGLKKLLIKNTSDIIFDVESFISFDKNNGLFEKGMEKEEPILAILGFINNNKYYNYTIQDFNKQDEEKIVKGFCNHLIKLSLKSELNEINIYHWGNAECKYFEYIHKTYPDIKFPDYKLVDVLDHFRMEPIIVQGIFKFGLKSIGKALHKNKLIKTTWENDNDNGLDAMIIFKNTCIKNNRKIPIKRYVNISNIIEYNRIDCQVLSEIINLLRNNYNQ